MSLTSVDFPDPLTPEIVVSKPGGRETVRGAKADSGLNGTTTFFYYGDYRDTNADAALSTGAGAMAQGTMGKSLNPAEA